MTILFCISPLSAQNPDDLVARLVVESGSWQRFNTPVSISLDDITSINESLLSMYEVTEEARVMVPVQFTVSGERRMHWILSGITNPGETRIFQLVREKAGSPGREVVVERDEGSYTILLNEKPVLQYNSAVVHPPSGADEAYRRSGFVHPLFSPDGSVLTEIQPPDHIHHYGLWNPWTKTTFREREVDFWNLAKGEGTVQYGGTVAIYEGPVFGGISLLHEHIAWPGKPEETTAMNELHEIRVYNRDDNTFLIDVISSLSPVEDIILEEYRYGGFVLRATAEWTNSSSNFFTSRGMDRDAADGERAEWCVVSGVSSGGNSGIFMMGFPANYNHPEPLRVWPADANRGRGDVFINFSPTRNTSWKLEAGNNYLLRYRMLVANDEIIPETASMLWDDYSNPPVISVEKKHARRIPYGK